jgi:hypothetical protein
MMHGSLVLLAVPVLLAEAFGGSIGDFSALEVGNKWEYKTTRSSARTNERIDTLSTTTVTVRSKEISEDTTVYSVSVSDSIYAIVDEPIGLVILDTNGNYVPVPKSTLPVNIVNKEEREIREADGAIQSDTSSHYCIVCQMFQKREYDESELRDTVIGSAPRKVKYMTANWYYDVNRWSMINDIGLVSYSFGITGRAVGFYLSYSLDKFNDEPISPIGISVRHAVKSGIHRVRPPLGGYNLLGRRLSSPGAVPVAGF